MKRNGQDRSPTSMMLVSQEEPSGASWKLAMQVSGVQSEISDTQTPGWGLPLSSSLNLIGFPPEMFIPFTTPLRSSSPTYLITIY